MKHFLIATALAVVFILSGRDATATGISEQGITQVILEQGYPASRGDVPVLPGMPNPIQTAVSGFKVLIQPVTCRGEESTICAMMFIGLFPDVRNLVNDGALEILNDKLRLAKAGRALDKQKAPVLHVSYVYTCKGATDAGVVPHILRAFGAELAETAMLYNGALATAARPQ